MVSAQPPNADPRYDFSIMLPQARGRIQEKVSQAYAFSAFLHEASGSEPAHYTVRLRTSDTQFAGGDSFCGRVICSEDGSKYTFCDDPVNYYSWPRELGAIIFEGDMLYVILPRVGIGGAAAQFRVLQPSDSILSKFMSGQAQEHLLVLSGPWAPADEVVQLHPHDRQLYSHPTRLIDDPVAGNAASFRAQAVSEHLQVMFGSPISAFQSFCMTLALVHHAQCVRLQRQAEVFV